MRTRKFSFIVCFLTLVGCGKDSSTDDGGDTGTPFVDLDQDGFSADEDCDDSDATAYPGADEICDAVDNDCDGETDEDAVDGLTAYADEDGDGYGASDNAIQACELPSGYVLDGTDCDDSNADVSPGSEEVCDGIDNDCDPASDEMGLASFVTAAGDFVDLQEELKGSVASPIQYTIAEEGDLQFCGGVYHVNLDVTASSNVVGLGADNSVVMLDGAANGPVVRSTTDGVNVGVENLTVQHGNGELALFIEETEMGGGIFCYAVDESGSGNPTVDVSLKNVVVKENTAQLGAGVAVLGGCSLTVEDADIRDNSASEAAGGIVAVIDKDVSIVNTVIEDNSATSGAGGLYYWNVSAEGTLGALTFDDVLVASNTADEVAGLVMLGADLIWTGSANGNSGIVGNTSVDGPGAFALYGSDAEFVDVDFGEAGTASENTPYDLAFEGLGSTYRIGDSASFECVTDGICGSMSEHVITETEAVVPGGSGGYAGTVFEATWSGTLEEFWIATSATSSNCTARPYLLSTSEVLPESSLGVVEFTRLERGSSQSLGAEEDSKFHLGQYIEAGNTYAVVASWTCSSSDEIGIGIVSSMSTVTVPFGTVLGTVADAGGALSTGATTHDLYYVPWPGYVAQSISTNDF